MSTACVTDGELVERARAGDTEAFGELARRNGPAVYRAALAALGSPSDAEDIAQEALVLAYRTIGEFRGEATFKTWVVAIAWKRALNYRRRRWRLQPLDEDGGVQREPVAPAPSAEHALIANELDKAARRVIQTLPSRLRDALLLVAANEHTYEELAVILGVPSGTLKWRVTAGERRTPWVWTPWRWSLAGVPQRRSSRWCCWCGMRNGRISKLDRYRQCGQRALAWQSWRRRLKRPRD